MPHELNSNIETLILLANTPWQGKNRAEAIQELDATGVDGAAFYSQNGAVIDRYYAAFEKGRVESPGTKLLSGIEELLFVVLLGIIWGHPDWRRGLEAVTEEELDETVKQQFVDAMGGQEDIIAGLEELDLSDQARWQAIVLLQKPRQQLGAVFEAIDRNIPAFENARDRVAKDLDGPLAEFDELSRSTYGSWPLDLSRVVGASAPIIPMLAAPFAVLYMDNACFCGLLCHLLFRSAGSGFSKEELLICAKALSDKSKVDILLCLKEESLYGLEIAEKIGLAPATVSHHMGILLAAGFVELEKRDGKVFYRLSQTGIQKFLSGTGRILL